MVNPAKIQILLIVIILQIHSYNFNTEKFSKEN